MHSTPTGRADRSRIGRPGRVLVVGCGFLGSHIAAGFLRRGVPTTVLVRGGPDPHAARLIVGARRLDGDAGDGAAVDAALEGVDHVVWAAGGLRPAESDLRKIDDVAAALPPLLTLLEQIAARDGTSLTFLSSGGTVYGTPSVLPVPELHHLQPITAHGVTKVASELYLTLFREVHGVRTVALRCGNVYGPGQRPNLSQGIVATALECALSGRPLRMFGDGAAVRDYVHIDDVVDVVCRLASREDVPEVVNVGTGEGTNLVDLLDIVTRVTRHRLTVEQQPARSGDVRSIVLDTTLLHSLIAYDPIPLEAGIAATWDAVSGAAQRAAR